MFSARRSRRSVSDAASARGSAGAPANDAGRIPCAAHLSRVRHRRRAGHRQGHLARGHRRSDEPDGRLPDLRAARPCMPWSAHIRDVQARIATLEASSSPGAGATTPAGRRSPRSLASVRSRRRAMAATVTDPSCFSSGRQLAAWLGWCRGRTRAVASNAWEASPNRATVYLRRLLVVGARTIIRYARSKAPVGAPWIMALLGRRPALVAAVALANKMARIAWAILARGDVTVPQRWRATEPGRAKFLR